MGTTVSSPTSAAQGDSIESQETLRQTSPSFSSSSVLKKPTRRKYPKEKSKYGVVHATVTSFTYLNRKHTESAIRYDISPRGAIFYGSQSPPGPVQQALAKCGRPILTPIEIPLNDSRANRLMVIYNGSWSVIPSQDAFSRHSGTCLVLGDRQSVSPPFRMKVGSCFRLGSVGVVVSEIRYPDGREERLDGKVLDYLRDEALALEYQEELATLAAEDDEQWNNNALPTHQEDTSVTNEDINNTINNNQRHVNTERLCYMCYETSDSMDDPLVAPCQCRGETRYLHASCLQKWHQSMGVRRSKVVRVTGNGALACRICGSAYKTCFRGHDGKINNLLEGAPCPSVTLVVVTRHDTAPTLFNTRFRLRMMTQDTNPNPNPNPDDNDLGSLLDPNPNPNPNPSVTIGRSSSCDLVLDYRTVSTIHAEVQLRGDHFYMVDKGSSNGTMVYLRDALSLSYGATMRIRMGRTSITLEARRDWMGLGLGLTLGLGLGLDFGWWRRPRVRAIRATAVPESGAREVDRGLEGTSEEAGLGLGLDNPNNPRDPPSESPPGRGGSIMSGVRGVLGRLRVSGRDKVGVRVSDDPDDGELGLGLGFLSSEYLEGIMASANREELGLGLGLGLAQGHGQDDENNNDNNNNNITTDNNINNDNVIEINNNNNNENNNNSDNNNNNNSDNNNNNSNNNENDLMLQHM